MSPDPFKDEIDADGAVMRDKMAGLRCFSCEAVIKPTPNGGGPQYCKDCAEDRQMLGEGAR